jgi:predicted acylesterase/phospholipase RssA
MLEITFDSCGWMLIFHMGVAQYLHEHLDLTKIKITSVSGGSLIGSALLSGVNIEFLFNEAIYFRSRYSEFSPYPLFNILNFVKGIINKYGDPDTTHKKLSSQMAVYLTEVYPDSGKMHHIKSFKDFDHFHDTVVASCTIPFINGLLPIEIKDNNGKMRYYYDGGFSDPMPQKTFNGDEMLHNIRVSATSREGIHDISLPCESSWSWSFVPARENTLYMINKAGYLLAKRFFSINQRKFASYFKPELKNMDDITFNDNDDKELDIVSKHIIISAHKRNIKEHMIILGNIISILALCTIARRCFK